MLQHSGCTVSCWSEANPTDVKLSQRLTQQGGLIDSCPLYPPPNVDGENAHIRWLSWQLDTDLCHLPICLLVDLHDNYGSDTDKKIPLEVLRRKQGDIIVVLVERVLMLISS